MLYPKRTRDQRISGPISLYKAKKKRVKRGGAGKKWRRLFFPIFLRYARKQDTSNANIFFQGKGMDFCMNCGGALNLFETNDDALCLLCRRKRDEAHPSPLISNLEGLFLRCQDNACQLVSTEGWVLWSAGTGQSVSLAEAVAKARRIQAIRRNRL